LLAARGLTEPDKKDIINIMKGQEPSTSGRYVFVLYLFFSILAGFAGTSGFVWWSHDPSRQKWDALFVGLLGWIFAFITWKIKDEFLYPQTTPESERVENKPIKEQRRHWIGLIQSLFALSSVGWLFLWLTAPLFERPRDLSSFGILPIISLIVTFSLIVTLGSTLFCCYKLFQIRRKV